jgi:hypothetical protein
MTLGIAFPRNRFNNNILDLSPWTNYPNRAHRFLVKKTLCIIN